MSTLVTTLTYDLPQPGPERLVEWGELLEQHDGSVAFIPGIGVQVTLWLDGYDVVKAPLAAADLVDMIVNASPIAVEVVSAAEHERRAEEPTLPRMVSAPEVAEMLGVSRQRVYQLRDLAAFPAPLYELRTGPIWDARAIEHFGKSWERKPGRPKLVALV